MFVCSCVSVHTRVCVRVCVCISVGACAYTIHIIVIFYEFDRNPHTLKLKHDEDKPDTMISAK